MFLPNNKELIDINLVFENGAQNLTKESFTFLTQIGTGSFGKVYKVSSNFSSQIFALKVLSKNQIMSLKLAEQLKNEITILSRCNHEGIIKLYAAFEDKGYIFLVTELANDSSLFGKLKKSKKFSESITAGYMSDIVQAICYLHTQKPIILHRDIKPENILINNSKCKIADFGWSNVEDDFRNTFCGTPDYLAPEMIQGTGHNEKLDIWTLGILMYELLHGNPPFSPREKLAEPRMMQRIIEKNILSGIIEFDPSLSNEAKQAITAMLSPDSKTRPTAKELIEFDFFKKFSKIMSRKNSESTFGQLPPSGRNNEVEVATLRAKLKEADLKIESLSTSNKNLNELLDSKEAKFRNLISEMDEYKQKYQKAKEDLENEVRNSQKGSFDRINTSGVSNSFGPKSVEELKKDLNRYKQELDKSLDTTKAIYDKAKGISMKVSDFYIKNILSQDQNQTSEFVLSFDSTLSKLDAVFDDYLRLKSKVHGNKISIFEKKSASKEPQSYRVFNKSRSPGKSLVMQEDEYAKIQNFRNNISTTDNSIKTSLSPLTGKKN